MRTFLALGLFGVCALAIAHAQPADDRVIGTWSGPVHCQHDGGDMFLMSIRRDANGSLAGTMDWARASSDGRRGPDVPFSTLRVDGARITATRVEGNRTARLDAAVEAGTIIGRWTVTGIDETWSFTGTRQ